VLYLSVAKKSFSKYEAPLTKIAHWLLENEVSGNFCLEVFLVPKKIMNKNVLAYPALATFPRPDLKGPSLGEIYLNPDYIAANQESLLYMFIHGFLHLRGYDHMKKNDRIEMEAREEALIRTLSLKFPDLASQL